MKIKEIQVHESGFKCVVLIHEGKEYEYYMPVGKEIDLDTIEERLKNE